MKYELALILKEAGYPQKNRNYCEEHGREESCVINDNENMKPPYCPTLEELIEAIVGDKPNTFYLEYNDNWSSYEQPDPEGMWEAKYYDLTPVGFYSSRGPTPTEAVANLWLALNKTPTN